MQLTIAIPTYNRISKISRLLTIIRDQILESPALIENVEILVSNNGSTDGTAIALEIFEPSGVQFRYVHQSENIGFDSNVLYLYSEARGKYVWFSSDDDIFYEGAIAKFISTLTQHSPTIFLTSFMQPPGTYLIRFEYQELCTVIENSETIADLVLSTVKITAYIVRKFTFSQQLIGVLNRFIGSEYGHVALAFTALLADNNPQLCVISEALTGSDNEYNYLRVAPDTWGKLWTLCNHPFVQANHPRLIYIQKRNSYFTMLEIFFQITNGKLVVENMNEYYEAIRKLKFHPLYFLKKPKYFKKYLVLKRLALSNL
jgi:glycosyltransferase involved in cell wall biosynthesis